MTKAVSLLKSVLSRQKEAPGTGSPSSISKREPKTYTLASSSSENIRDRLRRAAAMEVMDERQDTIPTDSIFFEIAQEVQTTPKMDYLAFCAAAAKVPQLAKRFFRARDFLRFPQDADCCIDTEDFLRYFQRSIDVETTILNLCSYAGAASELGSIREHELEHFLTELLPKIPHLRDIHESFVPFYVFAASRRFFFFLDSRRQREVSIRKLGTSTCMEELLFLQRLSQYQGEDASEMGIADQLSQNWFWPANAQSQYRTYLNLDRDRNGTITKEDLLEYQSEGGGLQLTRLTVERIFEENLTYLIDGRPEMDYKAFLDVVLAVEHREAPESVSYFWRLLDVEHTGKLMPATILHFYRSIAVALEEHGYASPQEDDVVREIYDIVGLKPGSAITLPDLMRSSQGPVVVAMLTDANSFWCYDNRENLLQSQES